MAALEAVAVALIHFSINGLALEIFENFSI